ncbi:MAG: energy transducer TonB [Burkholderiales bacterium]|nr:energy transducer TonB [Burkholderiales bacterium]
MVHWQKQNERHLFASAAAVGLHVLAVILLLQYTPVRSALNQAAPIMVSLLQSPKIEQPKEPPKPKPVAKQPARKIEPRPLLAVSEPVPTPSPMVAPPPPPPQPGPVPVAIAPPAPASVIPPNFNADYLNNPAPPYPALSRRMGEEGKVVLRVFVNPQGLPAQVELRTSSGFSRLDNVALETVRQWKFVPARRGEQSVGAWVLVPISFSLRS